MEKNDLPKPKETFSDKAKNVGKKAVKIGKIILVLLLIAGVVYVLKSCGIIGDHEKQDSGENTTVEQEYGDEENDATDNYDDYELDEEDAYSNLIDENGEYTTADDVALYIHTYHKLPSNYMTKKEATEKGYYKNPKKHGIMIGGDYFGNYEELLPLDEEYYECDVDYKGNGRGKNRLIYTTDGTVYHTKDHYEHFTQLY